MGAMKVLATKDAEGSASAAEQKALRINQELEAVRALLPLPSVRYQQKGDGPRTQLLYLAWPSEIFEEFKRNKLLYFFSWSQNWREEAAFHEHVSFLSLDEVHEFFHGSGKADVVKVSIAGPYDPSAFDEAYRKYSPYKDLKQAAAVKALCDDDMAETRPTYLWLATKP